MRALPLLSAGWAWLALALTLAIPAIPVHADSPPVKVQLRASWSKIHLPSGGSPFLLELLEAARSQRPSSFFPLVELLTSKYTAAELRGASDEWLANTVQELIQAHRLFGTSGQIADEALDTWRMSLALSNSSPRIQALVQLYQTLQLDETWRKGSKDASCVSWVHFRDQVLCSGEDVRQAVRDGGPATPSIHDPSRDVALGHSRSSVGRNAATQSLVLYADPFSDNFRGLFSALEEHTNQPDASFTYTLRWRPSTTNSASLSDVEQTALLSGYGAILDLKKVDYLVIDDRKLKDDSDIGDVGISASSQSEEGNAAKKAADEARWLRDQIGAESNSSSATLSSLSEDQIADLGIKAARLIMDSPDPLRALQELSQNFPLHAADLAQTTKWDDADRSAALVDAVLNLANMRIEPGHSDLWLNGQSTSTRDFLPLTLLETLRRERSFNHALQHPLAGGGLNVTEAGDLISSSLVGRAFLAQADGSAATAIFDASDRIEVKNAPEATDVGAITWLNDLEKDAATSGWSSDLMDLLHPMWPGKFPRLSLNLFNVVLVLDLSQKESCRFLADTVIQSLGRVGLHWGLVPGGLEDEAGGGDAVRMARLFWFLLDQAGAQTTSDVLRKAAASRAGTAGALDVSLAVKEAKFALKSIDADGALTAKLDEALSGTNATYTHKEALGRAYIKRLRATRKESASGHVFINGQHQPFHAQIVHVLHQTVQEQIQVLAPQIYYGQISGDTPGLETFFYDSVGALSFRSALVGGGGTEGEAGGVEHGAVDLWSALVDDSVPAAGVDKVLKFFYPAATAGLLNSTVWVIADLDSEEGVALLGRSFEALAKDEAKFRLGVLHVPSLDGRADARGNVVSTLLYRLLAEGRTEGVSPAQVLDVLKQAHDDPHVSVRHLEGALGLSTAEADSAQKAHQFWQTLSPVLVSELDISSSPAILVDGHLVSNLDPSTIEARDITALVEYEAGQKLPYIMQALKLLRPGIDDMPPRQRQDLVFAALSVMSGVYDQDSSGQGMFTPKANSRSGLPEQLGTRDHVFEHGERATADVRLTLLLNPLSEAAQRWSSLLLMLRELQGVYVRVILNPHIKLRELPLRRFYRFSAPHAPAFDAAGRAVATELRFFDMPEDAVLTLGLDAPAPWLTMPVEAVYDLDNIRLADVPAAARTKGVKAVYELKHILIEGHALQQTAASPAITVPRGLQLLLETPDGGTRLDTIVMANLAYFQFKAQPGLWKLKIRAGRSAELYEMQSVGGAGWSSASVGVAGEHMVLDTLAGLTIYPRVVKRRGKEEEELLEELDAQGRAVKPRGDAREGGVAASAGQLFLSARDKVASLARSVTGTPSSSTGVVTTRTHADINIFTVASGHLYERMTYIMVLSVLKHTRSSVKFWFIENFLSPSFKEFIPHLAAAYGFEYELVTYAWPHWLRAQTEKQRTIWGYKILFLDTLFPLDLGKVIFVDADQVVRTDMQELVDLDLEGNVYAYPPMGDDSDDMDGFRFWKHGYWKDYLRGRPYHISALYVVDLHRFRRVAAGDRLRGQYQALSADPNSLSNLDQDLPNNMQASLPIFTLPKEWLWCETWCSGKWLDKAKTIDLCSNPKTKEPKLDRAKRQIPEWTVYDREVARLAQRLVQEDKVGRSVVAPDSQVEAKHAQGEDKAADAHVHDEL
ncbi:related to UDP-glucose:glycoprotein glucosyltransferase precursor [Sporisorium reilianum f. sp. reilianum]|uniref:Related to UDP-glucose:glycoprotein glucosyltransferase n=1 Tax=Sporisorium reilianum f. sp. reilianum TaxID=72559 RepID=A0A2N8U960_9BASI|nr:related to UDP-glucose:glycoprotein glucosyltransferase precursor [Sporisorium reilianum f. sp. reilianum]